MKKILAGILLAVLTMCISGCNTVTRQWGGSQTIDLPTGMTFIEAEWDSQDNLWYTYRQRRQNEKPETYIMQEESNMGVAEGKITFVEH